MPKFADFCLKFEFQLSKYLVLEVTGEHFSSSKHIYWQHMGILPSLHFYGQILMHWLQCVSLTSKMLRLNSQLKKLPKNQKKSLFLPNYMHFWIKAMLIPNLRCMLLHQIYINHQECWFGRHCALGRRCYAKWLKKLFRISQIKI